MSEKGCSSLVMRFEIIRIDRRAASFEKKIILLAFLKLLLYIINLFCGKLTLLKTMHTQN